MQKKFVSDDKFEPDEPSVDDKFEPDAPMPPADPGFLSKVYHFVSDPLTDAPSRAAKYLEESVPQWDKMHQSMNDAIPGLGTAAAMGQGFSRGMVTGMGDFVSGLSSPGNLAMTALTAGSEGAAKQGLSTIAKYLSLGGKAAAVPGMLHGAGDTLSPNSTWTERGKGLVELAGNAAGMYHTPTGTKVELPGHIPEHILAPDEMAAGPIKGGVIPPEATAPLNHPSEPSFADIQKRMYELTDKATNGNITPPELTEAQALNKVWRNHPEFGKDVPRGSFGPGMDPNLNNGIGDAELAGSTPYKPTELSAPPSYDGPNFNREKSGGSYFDPETGEMFDEPPVNDNQFGGEGPLEDGSFDPETGDLHGIPNPEFNARRQAMVEDTARMERENNNRPHNQEQADYVDKWERGQNNNDIYEGRFNEPNSMANTTGDTSNYSPEQLAIKESYERMKAHSDVYNREFSRLEEELPEGEYFNPPDEMRLPYEAEQARLKALHEGNVAKLTEQPIRRGPPPDIGVHPDEFGNQVMKDLNQPQLEAGPLSFTDRLRNTFNDETGSIPRRDPSPIPETIEEMAARTGQDLQSPQALDAGDMGPAPPDIPIEPEPPQKPTMQTAPMGQVVMITPEGLAKNANIATELAKHGFQFDGTHHNGKLRFKKVREAVVNPPILEADVDAGRVGRGRQKLGPSNDVKRGGFTDLFNMPRTLMAAGDLSGPLRQGLGLIHKKAFWTSLRPMIEALGSEGAYEASQQAIANRPLFKERVNAEGKVFPSFADEAGLKLGDLTDKREEAILSQIAEKVPGVRASNRAYTAFLNNLRADTFESLVKDGKIFGVDAKANIPLAKELADFVNTASGRGSLGAFEKAAVPLSNILFSPRLIASRLQMMSPRRFIMASPQVRRETLKSLFAIAAAGNTVTTIGQLAGGTVSMDPSSADFGKLKIGDTRIDPYGGFQQYIVAGNRLLNPMGPATGFAGDTPFTRGQMTTSSVNPDLESNLWEPEPGPFASNWGSVAGRMVKGKLHPVIGFAYALATGRKEMSGKEMDLTTLNPMDNAVMQRFIPILWQDLYEIAQDPDMPPGLKATVGTLSTFGMGTQTYGPDEN